MEIVQASPVKTYEYFIDRIEICKIKLSVLNIQNGKKYFTYINESDDIWMNNLSNIFQKNFNKCYEFIELVFENKLPVDINIELSINTVNLIIKYDEGFMPINITLNLKEEEQSSNDTIIFQLQQCKNENTSMKNEINELNRKLLGLKTLNSRIDELTNALNLFGKSHNIKNNFYPGHNIIYPITDGEGKQITDTKFWKKYDSIGQPFHDEMTTLYDIEKNSRCFYIGRRYASFNMHDNYLTRNLLKKIETDVFKYTLKIFNIDYDFNRYGRDWKKLIEILPYGYYKGTKNFTDLQMTEFLRKYEENTDHKLLLHRKTMCNTTEPINSSWDVINVCWDIYIVEHYDELLSWDNFKKINDIKY